MKKSLIKFQNPPIILSTASVVGSHEFAGPLGRYFDLHGDDDKFGMKTWEMAESEMQRLALSKALSKLDFKNDDIDALFAGDLVNQCTCSAQGLLPFNIPYFGLYGACSTAAEGLCLSSMLISNGTYQKCAVVTSSHNCTSERQYRFPLEYGGQRTPTSQFTVTGAGAFIIGNDGTGAAVEEAEIGKMVDWGITDANNMGAAMAPSCLDTLERYFCESDNRPSDFDMIITGDLGYEGSEILIEKGKEKGIDLEHNLYDCGLLIFDRYKQDMHAGGSGCGCFASVMSSLIIPKLISGELKNILAIATGALMSPLSVEQGQSIPGISHLLKLTHKA